MIGAIKSTRWSVSQSVSHSCHYVLIEGMGQVADAVDIAPMKLVGQTCRIEVRMRQGRGVIIVDGIVANLS